MLKIFKIVPNYIWTLVALISGLLLGSQFIETLTPVADQVGYIIKFIVTFVPLLIFAALSPAIATLVRRGLAGRFAASVILWYVLTSAMAGLFGLTVSSLIFRIPFISEHQGSAWTQIVDLVQRMGEDKSALWPLAAIAGSIIIGMVGALNDSVYRFLQMLGNGLTNSSTVLTVIMPPLIFLFGIKLGVTFGLKSGTSNYFTMVAYTAALCGAWWLFYTYVILRLIGGVPVRKVLTEYYIPTALFAAGSCSSMLTLPVNLANVNKLGVRKEVSEFIIPFGAIANMDASALAYVAYAPFVLSYIFGIEIDWLTMLAAWPALVLFTIAAPGLPAGMGTAAWSSALFASLMGLEGDAKINFIATWIALAGGIPDMFRSATNCTGDGYTAILFDRHFDRFFGKAGSKELAELAATAQATTPTAPPAE